MNMHCGKSNISFVGVDEILTTPTIPRKKARETTNRNMYGALCGVACTPYTVHLANRYLEVTFVTCKYLINLYEQPKLCKLKHECIIKEILHIYTVCYACKNYYLTSAFEKIFPYHVEK